MLLLLAGMACGGPPPQAPERFLTAAGAWVDVPGEILDLDLAEAAHDLPLVRGLARVHGGATPPAFFGGMELRQDLAMLADQGISHVALQHAAVDAPVGTAVAGIFGGAVARSAARVLYAVPPVEATEQELAMWRVLADGRGQ